MRYDVPPTPLEYFAVLVQGDEIPLLEAAACIAHDDEPGLDVQQVLGDVDQLLARVRRRLPPDAGALQRLGVLNQFFYGELGVGGNLNDYYAPANSYVHAVLRTRRGIPISLAVLWLELAQGLGLRAQGVGFPGHFLVKVLLPAGQVVIDPMTGESLSRESLSERLEPFRRAGAPAESSDAALGLYLQAALPRDILARMLRNLKEIHRAHRDWARQAAVLDRLVLLLPEAWTEWRDRGLAHAELGHHGQAAHDLDVYLAHAPEAADAPAIRALLGELRKA